MNPSRTLTMLALVISGEAIFFLPFILPRVFRPTMLEVFDMTNLDLGFMFTAYGVVALISYFLGGPLADRFSPRNLMTAALIATSGLGFFMAFYPGKLAMMIIYSLWGATTILLFWSALIKATREWGGPAFQGRAFGLLDAGRGLSGALIATLGVTVLGNMLPEEVLTASAEQKAASFRWVILVFSAFTLLVSLLVWFVLPGGKTKENPSLAGDLKDIGLLLKKRTVWLQSIIIICAYVGYKITDDFSLYASEVLGMDDVNAAGVGTFALWLRPVAALTIGFLADRLIASRLITFSFLLVTITGLILGTGVLPIAPLLPFYLSIIFMSMGVYGLRALYYAIMEEAHLPLALTGTAVGIVSVVGYTPDIFIGPVMGWLLDSSPGPEGHKHVFLLLTGFSAIGAIAGVLFRRTIRA